MLSQIELHDFKCFEILRLPLRPLTLLSGPNASGKSTTLQSLVLLQQTMSEHEWSTKLVLNGSSIRLGTVHDVVDESHGRHSFEIGIKSDDLSCQWTFSGSRGDMSMRVERITIGVKDHNKPRLLQCLLPVRSEKQIKQLAIHIRGLTYITAERIGPRDIYPLEDNNNDTVVGPTGANSASILCRGKDEHVIKDLLMKHALPTRLHQVNARMQSFFPGCNVDAQEIPQANAVMLKLRASIESEYHRPINEGYGLTQVFPIIIAALSAAKGDILLIENPEVHLHPAGQALMGQFLAEVARADIQVIIETHSDHVLNGIRRAVKRECLSPDKTAIHFFKPRSKNTAQVVSPIIDNSGNIDSWPEGFFDQFDKDMNYFAGWGE